jgi:hypothetical protein
MRFFASLFFFVGFTLSTASWAEPLTPVINFLRSTPAFFDGSVAFKSSAKVFEEGWTTVKINANQSIGFKFKENMIEVYPGEALDIRSYYLKVKVKYVRWHPTRGFYADAELPLDITGLSRSSMSATVAQDLEEIFGEKMKRANNILRRVRSLQNIGASMEIVDAIVSIFKEEGSGIVLPKYYGETGLNFTPSAKALQLYGMRVGIKAGDNVRTGFSFNGDEVGIYPHSLSVTSSRGIDINEGATFRQNMRIVFNEIRMDSKGTSIAIDLGATETIAGILSAIEIVAAASGRPMRHCHECYELATLPPIRLMVESKVRSAILAQIDALWPSLQLMHVTPAIFRSFKKNEACKLSGITCSQECSRGSNSQTCKKGCESKMNQCAR